MTGLVMNTGASRPMVVHGIIQTVRRSGGSIPAKGLRDINVPTNGFKRK
jgi:hypothetical protein